MRWAQLNAPPGRAMRVLIMAYDVTYADHIGVCKLYKLLIGVKRINLLKLRLLQSCEMTSSDPSSRGLQGSPGEVGERAPHFLGVQLHH